MYYCVELPRVFSTMVERWRAAVVLGGQRGRLIGCDATCGSEGSLDVGRGRRKERRRKGRDEILSGFVFFLRARFSSSLGGGRGACGEGRSRDMYEVALGPGEGEGGGVTKYIPPSIHPIAYLFPTLDWDGPQ